MRMFEINVRTSIMSGKSDQHQSESSTGRRNLTLIAFSLRVIVNIGFMCR